MADILAVSANFSSLGIDIDQYDLDGKTPFMIASENNHINIVIDWILHGEFVDDESIEKIGMTQIIRKTISLPKQFRKLTGLEILRAREIGLMPYSQNFRKHPKNGEK